MNWIFSQVLITYLIFKFISGKDTCSVNQYYDKNSQMCQECNQQCFGCIGPEDTECILCSSSSYYNIHTKTCSDQCDYTILDGGENNRICYKCSLQYCKKCKDIWSCSECIDGFELNQYGECVNQCQYGYYFDEKECSNTCSATIFKNVKTNVCESKYYCPSYEGLTDFCTSKQQQFALLVDNTKLYSFYEDGYMTIHEYPTLLFIADTYIDIKGEILKWFVLNENEFTMGCMTTTAVFIFDLKNFEILLYQVISMRKDNKIGNLWKNQFLYFLNKDGGIQIYDLADKSSTIQNIVKENIVTQSMWHNKYTGVFLLADYNKIYFATSHKIILIENLSLLVYKYNRFQSTQDFIVITDDKGLVNIYKLDFKIDSQRIITQITMKLIQNNVPDIQQYNYQYISLQLSNWIYVPSSDKVIFFLIGENGQIDKTYTIQQTSFKLDKERFVIVINKDKWIEIYDMIRREDMKIYSYRLNSKEDLDIQQIILGEYLEKSNQFEFILIPYDGFKISVITSHQNRIYQQCIKPIQKLTPTIQTEQLSSETYQLHSNDLNWVFYNDEQLFIPNSIVFNEQKSILAQFCYQGYFKIYDLESSYFVNSMELKYKPQKIKSIHHFLFQQVKSVFFLLVDYSSIYLVILDSYSLLIQQEKMIISISQTDDVDVFFDLLEWRVYIYKRGFYDYSLLSIEINIEDPNNINITTEKSNGFISRYSYLQAYLSFQIILLREEQQIILKGLYLNKICSYEHKSNVPFKNNYQIKNSNFSIIFFEDDSIYELNTNTCEVNKKVQTPFTINQISAGEYPRCLLVQGKKEAIIYDTTKYSQLYRISSQNILSITNLSWVDGFILGFIEDNNRMRVFNCQYYNQKEIQLWKNVLQFQLISASYGIVIYSKQGVQLYNINTGSLVVTWNIITNTQINSISFEQIKFAYTYTNQEISNFFAQQQQRYFVFQNSFGELSFLFNPLSSLLASQVYPSGYQLDYFVTNTTLIEYITQLKVFIQISNYKLTVVSNIDSTVISKQSVKTFSSTNKHDKIIYNQVLKKIVIVISYQILILDPVEKYKKLKNRWCYSPLEKLKSNDQGISLVFIMKQFQSLLNIYDNIIEVISIQQEGKIIWHKYFESFFVGIKCYELMMTCVNLDLNQEITIIRYISKLDIETTVIRNLHFSQSFDDYIKNIQKQVAFDESHGCILIGDNNTDIIYIYCIQIGRFQFQRVIKLKNMFIKFIAMDKDQETLIYMDDGFNIQGVKISNYSNNSQKLQTEDYLIATSLAVSNKQPNYIFFFDRDRSVLILGYGRHLFLINTITSQQIFTLVLQNPLSKITYESNRSLIHCYEEYYYEQVNLDVIFQQLVVYPLPSGLKSYSLLAGFIYFQMDILQQILIAYDERNLPTIKRHVELPNNFYQMQNIQFSLVEQSSDQIDLLVIQNNQIARINYNRIQMELIVKNIFKDPDNDSFQSDWVLTFSQSPKNLIIFHHSSYKIKFYNADYNNSTLIAQADSFLQIFQTSSPLQQYLITVDRYQKCQIIDLFSKKISQFHLSEIKKIKLNNTLERIEQIIDVQVIEKRKKLIVQSESQFFLLSIDHLFDNDRTAFLDQEFQLNSMDDVIEQLFVDPDQELILITLLNSYSILLFSITQDSMIDSNLVRPAQSRINILASSNYLIVYSYSSFNVFFKLSIGYFQTIVMNYNHFQRETSINEISLLFDEQMQTDDIFFLIKLNDQIKIIQLDTKNLLAPILPILTLFISDYEISSVETFNFQSIQYFYFNLIRYGERVSVSTSYDLFITKIMIEQDSHTERSCVFEIKQSENIVEPQIWNIKMNQINQISNKLIEELVIRVLPNSQLYIPILKEKLIGSNGIYVSFTQGTKFKKEDNVYLPLKINLQYISIFQIYNLPLSFNAGVRFVLDGQKSKYLNTVFLERVKLGGIEKLVDNSFIFSNLELVSIKDLVIKDIGSINNFFQIPLFLFKNVTKVILMNIKVSNISEIYFTTLFSFQDSREISIQNFTFSNNVAASPYSQRFEALNSQSLNKDDSFFIRNSQVFAPQNISELPYYKFIYLYQDLEEEFLKQDSFTVIDYSHSDIDNSSFKKSLNMSLIQIDQSYLYIVDEGLSSYVFSFYNTFNVTISDFTLKDNLYYNLARLIIVQNCNTVTLKNVDMKSQDFKIDTKILRNFPNTDGDSFQQTIDSSNEFDEGDALYEDYSQLNFNMYNLQPLTARAVISFHNLTSIKVSNIQMSSFQIEQSYFILFSILQSKCAKFVNNTFNEIFQMSQLIGIILKTQSLSILDNGNLIFENNYNIQYLVSSELTLSRAVQLYNDVVLVNLAIFRNCQNIKSYIQIHAFEIKISNSRFFNLINQQNKYQDTDYSENIQFDDYGAVPAGIINVFNFNYFEGNNLTFFQCKCQYVSGISLTNGQKALIQDSKFEANVVTYNGGGIFIFKINQIIILHCQFLSNKSQIGSGGAIGIIQSTIDLISQCEFQKNMALSDSGGAIYIDSSKILRKIENNVFQKNKAAIGAAIRIINSYETFNIPQIIECNFFQNNTALLYGKNVATYPQSLSFVDENLQKYDLQMINHTSGSSLKDPLVVALFDESNNIVIPPSVVQQKQSSDYDIFSNRIYSEFQNYQLVIHLQDKKNEIVVLGKPIYSYEEEKSFFYFNLTLIGIIQTKQIISIQSIKYYPQVLKQQINNQFSPLQIKLQVSFTNCVKGEVPIYQPESNLTVCSPCPSGKYSLEKVSFEDILAKKQITCQLCPEEATYCERDIIKLKNGYWKNEDSDKIFYCNQNAKNCKAEMYEDNQICTEGNIGVFCKECDYTGQVWGEKYGRFNTFSCQKCEDSYNILNQLVLLTQILLLIIYILYQLSIQRLYAKKSCIAYYLRRFKIIPMGISEFTNLNAVYTKLLINHLQILALFSQLNIPIPRFLSISTELFGGDPNNIVSTNIDCISSEITALPTYANITLISILNPFILFILVVFIRCGYIMFRFIKGNVNALLNRRREINMNSVYVKQKVKVQRMIKSFYIKMITCLIFLYFFFAPSILNRVLSYMVCAKIDTIYYIIGMSNLTCYDNQHKFYLFFFLLPLCMIWGLIIPAYFFFKLRANSYCLDQIRMKFQFGFIYQEYRRDCYYWEFVKIYLKFTIITALIVFYEQQTLRILVVATLILVYNQLVYSIQPFISNILNNTEMFSTITLIFTAFLLLPINDLTESLNIAMIIITMFIIIINLSFLLYMLKLIFLQPLPYSYLEMNYFQKIIYKLKLKFPSLFRSLKFKPSDPYRVFRNWKNLKNQIFYFIKYKQSRKLEEDQLIQILSTHRIKSHHSLAQSIILSKESENKDLSSAGTLQILSQSPTQILEGKVLQKNLRFPPQYICQDQQSHIRKRSNLSSRSNLTSIRKQSGNSGSSCDSNKGSSYDTKRKNIQQRQNQQQGGILLNKTSLSQPNSAKSKRKISFPTNITDSIQPIHKLSSFSKFKDDIKEIKPKTIQQLNQRIIQLEDFNKQ